jgi:phosphoglycerate dehydrogenase-like enzyme
VAWSQNLTEERAEHVGVRRASSELDLVAAADVLTLHLVLSRRSRGIVGERELAAMKRTAFLVNTSRAGLVDTAALVAALTEGRIAGAGLDVFDTEPLPEDDVLRSLPNVLATPHLGYVTKDNYTRYYTEAVEDIEAFLAGTPVRELP